jgi:cytochrome b561
MNPDRTAQSLPTNASPATPWRYGGTAVGLHWLLALLLSFIAALGWYMMSVEDEPGSGRYFELHKSIGLVIALLVAARIVWRLTHRPASLPTGVPPWQVRLSAVSVGLLYALMVLMPLTGYLGASYSKSGVPFFGLATPRWALPDHDTAERFFDIHGVLIWVLVALVAVHVLGALKHLLIDKDGVFQRMGFGGRQ